ncbi:V-type proton ATPase subunit S1-like [Phaenicophaeus curvirostris]|uniref:V-type proton ATPase subunit S1-like n=1 Tax=Phaenicophaeus curvirostris TaxID=33595 RepID=UPI0037F0FC2C
MGPWEKKRGRGQRARGASRLGARAQATPPPGRRGREPEVTPEVGGEEEEAAMAAAMAAGGRVWVGVWVWVWLLGLGPGAAAEQVPLIAWSTDRSLWPPRAAPWSGRVLGGSELEALLEPALKRGPRTVLLVLQDQLSLEDFTAYGDSAFSNLQAALWGAGSVLVVPALGGAPGGSLPHGVAGALGSAPRRLDPHDLRRLNGSRPGLLLLRLPHSSSFMSAREALTSNDAVLGEALAALREAALPHTVLLTAPRRDPRRPLPPPSAVGPAVGRSLLWGGAGAADQDPPPPLRWPHGATPKLLLWARNVTVTRGRQLRDLTPQTFGSGAAVDLGGSSWTSDEARLVLRYDDVFGATLNITFVLRQRWFPVSGRPWFWLSEVALSEAGGPPVIFEGSPGGVSAPTPLSWRCGELEAPGPWLRPRGDPKTPAPWGLRIQDLQVQAFGVSGSSFSEASDCAAFFSPGAWMGLVTASLLLGGLLAGGGLLLRLRTMDRFDDPRGPPLPVPQGE